jgi:hypothetical protein
MCSLQEDYKKMPNCEGSVCPYARFIFKTVETFSIKLDVTTKVAWRI